jgi:hypothetical protein
MRLKFERTDERLTRRTGLILINRFGDKINLASTINRAFREPGSNRGRDASDYVLALSEMIIDGATCLEDIRLFENDEAYKELADVRHYPSSDAIGDWLRRHGGTEGEVRLWTVISSLVQTLTGTSGLVLDIDSTLIEADKGDAQPTYRGFRGYHPLVGGCTELGLLVGSRFQPGNAVTQEHLVSFIHQCLKNAPGTFSTIRMDSIGFNQFVLNDCFNNGRRFSVTADHDSAVMDAVHKIPKNAWKQGRNADGTKADYHVAETNYALRYSREAFRLVVKRSHRRYQSDLFEGDEHYWIIATNIPEEEKDTQAIIHFHEQRGLFEKMIGELKHNYAMHHLPCGQFSANSLYFTIGILAFTLVQLLKHHYFGPDWKNKSVRSLRYYWINLPARIVSHARYTVAKVAALPSIFEQLLSVYLQLRLAPASG